MRILGPSVTQLSDYKDRHYIAAMGLFNNWGTSSREMMLKSTRKIIARWIKKLMMAMARITFSLLSLTRPDGKRDPNGCFRSFFLLWEHTISEAVFTPMLCDVYDATETNYCKKCSEFRDWSILTWQASTARIGELNRQDSLREVWTSAQTVKNVEPFRCRSIFLKKW